MPDLAHERKQSRARQRDICNEGSDERPPRSGRRHLFIRILGDIDEAEHEQQIEIGHR